MENPLRIEPWDDSQSDASRMLWLSTAYAEGATILSESLVEDGFQSRHESTLVILHLCRHAYELFLKGAISSKTGKPPAKTHRLDVLHARYRSLYPLDRYQIDAPFSSQVFEDVSGG